VLDIIATWKFPRTLPRCAQYTVTEAFWGSQTVLLLPWKQNIEAGLMWKTTWSSRYHVLSFEYPCFRTTNRLSLRIDCNARCIIKSCFQLFLLVFCGYSTVVALEKLYN